MNKLFPIIAAVVSASGLAATACTVTTTNVNSGTDAATGDDASSSPEASTGDDGSSPEASPGDDGGTVTDAATEAATPTTNVRFANWSPDSPAAGYDLCVAPHGSTNWSGPQLAAAVGDAGTLALTFPTVTTYFGLDTPGQYDVEIVQAGATDCSTPVGSALTNLPNLTANNFFTIAFVGDTTVAGSDQGLAGFGFQDDAPRTDGNVNLRFLNAAPGLSGATTIDFGTGALGASSFVGLETGIAFATLPAQAGSDAGTVDTAGYLALPAFTSNTEFSAHTTTGATTDTATVSGQTLAANTSSTIVLVNGKTGGAAANILVCTGDTTVSATSLLSSCTAH